jgi:N-acetylmuramic acid 6-phosphate etherase
MNSTENSFFNEIINLPTEQVNPVTKDIDKVPLIDILKMINNEDKQVAFAVEKEIPHIAQAVELIKVTLQSNGRLIYIGAGTSGRLGVIDAAECPPTFGTNPEMIVGVIAGGKEAMFVAQEGAEDNTQQAIIDLQNLSLNDKDVVCGIAASGRTPYVKSGVNYAKSIGCKTIMLSTSNRENVLKLDINADVVICPFVGPEAIAGSTRMKSGTAQKLVLNMLTTATMVLLGKTYNNIMVDLQQTNAKLVERSKNTIMTICNVDYQTATDLLAKAHQSVKHSIMMGLTNLEYSQVIELLKNGSNRISDSLKLME